MTGVLGRLTRSLGGVTSVLGGLTCRLRGSTRILGSSTETFLVLPDFLEFLPIAVANLSRFLRQYSELFRALPGRLSQVAVLFRLITALLGVLTAILRPFAHALSQDAPLLIRKFTCGHVHSL